MGGIISLAESGVKVIDEIQNLVKLGMPTPTHHIDINHPDFIASPYAQLKALRDESPAYHDPVWNKVFFTRHADITSLLRDKRLGRTMLHLYSREEIGWPPPDVGVQVSV